jgi:uncharacterized membrane protein
MLPSWAPNLHPLVVHFPIVLILVAVAIDIADLGLNRPALRVLASALYSACAVAAGVAYWTGTRAAATVFVPGMAHPLVEDHRVWALAALAGTIAAAAARLGAGRMGVARSRRGRVALAAAGLLAAVLVQQAAERGARLVYEHGVGVIPGPR